MAAKKKKNKPVRLFKVARELNVAKDTIEEYLDDEGYELQGSGLNAKVSPEVYAELLVAFADDKEAALRHRERVREMKQEDGEEQPEAEEETDEEELEEDAVVEEEEETEAEVDEEEEEADDEVETVEAESEEEAEETGAEEEEEEDTTLRADRYNLTGPRVVEDDQDEEEAETVEAEAEEVTEEGEEAEEAVAEQKEEETKTVETVKAEAETGDSDEEAEATAEAEGGDEKKEDDVLRGNRYRLSGPSVVGSMDVSQVGKSEKEKEEEKAAEKSQSRGVASTEGGEVTIDEEQMQKARKQRERKKRREQKKKQKQKKQKKKKKKRGRDVDEESVEQKIQETRQRIRHGDAHRKRRQRRQERRERHAEKRRKEEERKAEQEDLIEVTEFVSAQELANLMEVDTNDIISTCMELGMMVSINQRLDADTITLIADEYGYDVEFIDETSFEEVEIEDDDPEDLEPRAPVVTVMGHVDHGKTSLLDYIRRTNVVAGEEGGITQHIGAYEVTLDDGDQITFLDTPGHEAFTAMRARGAQVTDVVVLVVAGDDAVMPQTVEAINHAQAAEVPLVVAINKMDKREADAERVRRELSENGVLVEEYGGDVQSAEVSAETGDGVDDLLEKILLQAELLELQANPDREAVGTIVESRLEQGRGNVATVLVQNGTLEVGQPFVAGAHSGRVRAMLNERNQRVEQAPPSTPVLVLGFDGSPDVGDQFLVLEDESEAREIAQRRQQIRREQRLRQKKHITLDEIGRRLALGDFQELNLVIKADVGGSVQALSDALLKLSTEEVQVNIVHSGVGAITESDVLLASASDAVIIGFQVRPMQGVRDLAEKEEIDIRTYSVIYQAVEDVRDALEGLLTPEKSEEVKGMVEVRETFSVPKAGTVAGCYVREGKVEREDNIRVIRDGVVIYEGTVDSLKRFQEDVTEVNSGYECGIGLEKFNDLKVGDEFEVYEIIETKRTLESV